MKYLKPYNEIFGFLKKKSTKSNIDHVLSFVSKNYKKLDLISADMDRSPSISYMDSDDFVTYLFSSDDGKYSIHTMYIGKESSNEEITKEQYDKALKICQKISDYLDKKSDEGKSSVGASGELNMDIDDVELLEIEATEKITQALGDLLNKDYEFEVKKMARDTNSDRKMIKIKEISPQVYFADKTIFFKILMVMDGQDYFIQFDEKTPTQYIDLENRKIGTMVMKMFPDTTSMTRSQIRNDKRGMFDLSPSKYNTIEFLNP